MKNVLIVLAIMFVTWTIALGSFKLGRMYGQSQCKSACEVKAK